MTVTLADLFDPSLLDQMIEQGYIRRQFHPTLPLAILNYSELAQFDRVWNAATRQCRGLIYNIDTGRIVARPFPKFYNHGEPEATGFGVDENVIVTDKADGSLGILYPDGDGYSIATRGSFTSEQALHATAVWKRRYDAHLCTVGGPPHGFGLTMLFEVIYPANRIVCDYSGLDDLVLLGAVGIRSGSSIDPQGIADITNWPGPVIDVLEHGSFRDALLAPPRPGKEGMVVHFQATDVRVKLKQADYVRLHRIVTGLSTRTVWEHLAAGLPLADLLEPLPDEFHPWVNGVASELSAAVRAIRIDVEDAHERILDDLPEGWTRKDYALVAKEHPHKAALFRHLDGRDFSDYAWKLVKPEREMAAPGAPVRDEAVA